MKINLKYLAAFFCLLLVEITIALFVNDTIIRPYGGDLLVVILVYTLLRSFIQRPVKFLPVYIFLFAVIVELAQYYGVAYKLNLHENKVFAAIMGTTFDPKDILSYLIGTIILIGWERLKRNGDGKPWFKYI